MVNFKEIEDKAVEAVKAIVHEAAANEPTLGALVRTALEGAGVPPVLATGAVDLVEGLLAHFTTAHATTPVATPPAEPPAPVTPEPAATEVSTASVAAPAAADPFAPAATEPTAPATH